MLSNANMWHHRNFRVETISTACYLVNRSSHSSINFKIPEEVWSGNPVDYSILRVFDRSVFAYVNNGKLAPTELNACF